MTLTLAAADTIADAALAHGAVQGWAPMCIVVLDAGGTTLLLKRQAAAAPYRVDIAAAKAAGCIGMGMGGRAIAGRAAKVPQFYAAVAALVPIIPVAGGVLVLDAGGAIVGAVGVSGDSADNDESCALAGVSAAAGLTARAGEA